MTEINDNLTIFLIQTILKEKRVLNTYLTKLAVKQLNVSRYQVYRRLKKLEELQIIKKNKISKKLSEFEVCDIRQAFDLINGATARNTSTSKAEDKDDKKTNNKRTLIKNALMPRWNRISSFAKIASEKLFQSSTLSSSEQEEIAELFELWVEDIKQKILVLEDQNGENYFLEYKTRFTSKAKAFEILKKAEEAFETAKSMNSFGIFLTITIPPIFPQRIALWILSFLIHRIKAFCFRKFKFRPQHFRVDEPQRSFYPHTHIIIFGIDFLMYKNELTSYLEKHLYNFLSSLGKHYKKTINKRADEETIQQLNKLGSIYIKRYNEYKKKKPNYMGPINWITKIELKEGQYTFNQPPPDAKVTKNKDGGMITVFDYIKFYMVKNLNEAIEDEKNNKDGYKPRKVKNKSLVWYWAHRRPFFFCSTSLRTNYKRKEPMGWRFIGAFYIHELEDYFNVKLNI